jgi:predicted nucleic acid-binding protein
MEKVLIDSDIILDVATGREPFTIDSTSVLSLIECGYAIGTVSSNSVTNIYYILRKLSSGEKARNFLRTLLEYVSVISVSHEAIRKALDSKFTDFEDGVQHFCALENRCDTIITKNGNDYAFSEIEILEPREFVLLFDNT